MTVTKARKSLALINIKIFYSLPLLFLMSTSCFTMFLTDPENPRPTTSAPTVGSISPTSGTTNGETAVTITGTGFLTGAVVSVGGSACVDVSINSTTEITCTTPPHMSGAVSVAVTNTDEQSGTSADLFTYTAMGRTKLSDLTVSSIANYFLTPDSKRVVFTSTNSGVTELYSVKVDGTGGTKISGTMVSGGNIGLFVLSPDSSKVVYSADQDTDTVSELYVVDIDGSNNRKLSGTMVSGGDILPYFVISPDSSKVAYIADQDTDGDSEIFSVSLDGTNRVKLNNTLPVGGDIGTINISPDSSKVLYAGDQDTDTVTELYSVNMDGTGRTKLSGTMVAGGDIIASALVYGWTYITTFDATPDSSKVLYTADQDSDEVYELYAVGMDGSGRVKLNGTMTGGGNVGTIFRITPDSSGVIYTADQDTDTVTEVYYANLDGSGQKKISGTMVSGGDATAGVYVGGTIGFHYLALSPDGKHAFYVADQDTDTEREIYSTPLSGQTPIKMNGTSNGNGLTQGKYTPDSSKVVYFGDQDTTDVDELYVVNVDGTGRIKLNGSLVSGGDIWTNPFLVTSDSSKVVYCADQETDGTEELYLVNIDGTAAQKISGSVSGSAVDVVTFRMTDSSSAVIYLTISDELYAVGL